MADKRHRSGAHNSSVPNRYLSDPSRISTSGPMGAPSAHRSKSAGRKSSIGFTSPSDSSMNPGSGRRLPLPSHTPFSGNSSPQSLPPGVSTSRTASNQWTSSPTYFGQGWCYMTASPEPMDYANHGHGDDLGESIRVFPSQSQRTTLIKDEYAEKETTRDETKRRNHTDTPTYTPTNTPTNTPNAGQFWAADPRGCLMSQGAMYSEDHKYYDEYFGIPGGLGIQSPYPYARSIEIEDPNKPESTDRPENLDVAVDSRASGGNQRQEEEEEWDDCAVEGGYPESDGPEHSQESLPTQRFYQAGAASWFPYLYRH